MSPDRECAAATPFHDLDAYMALPRVSDLAMSPDGTRLLVVQSTPDEKGVKYVGALWEIAAERTAAMGGSFGGYMTNWIAGHTDRFRAIVTHASVWALDQFGPTTDAAWYWMREMTPEMAVQNSPHLFVPDIVTPMLVIHGDKDYRVPIGEGLRLWYELLSESGLPADENGNTEHCFLYFPDENHWVLTPQHAKIWYQVVDAFLSEHVLGKPTPMPEALG